jgi:hypothetical protein
MDSYEIIRPTGEGTGIWACGKCNQIHLLAWQGVNGATATNKARADACCAPKNCYYCGLPTELDSRGQYPYVHNACIPVVEPDPPHPSLANPFARLLYRRMSDISEECWSAGWELGNEYALWRMIHGGPRAYGRKEVSSEDLEELQALSEHVKGWIWSGGAVDFEPQLVGSDEWSRLFMNEAQELEDTKEDMKKKGFFILPDGWKPGDEIP